MRLRTERLLTVATLVPAAFAAAMVSGFVGAGMANASARETTVLGRRLNASASPVNRPPQDRFQHVKHERLFPLCSTCHAGVTESGRSIWPDPAQCTSCHDGVVKPRIAWQPRTTVRAGNLRFTHEAHALAATAKNAADSAVARDCAACHTERGASRMSIRNAVVAQCITCHGLTSPHIEVPSEACATCHVPLAAAPGLTRDDIARFPKPSSHSNPEFSLGGHGREAKGARAPRAPMIAASCATCHVQNFCVACHVNAPDVPEIRALAPDERAPVFVASLRSPRTHASASFLRTHGRDASRASATCATCHTKESCTSCHVGEPLRAIAAMPAAGPGRARGAETVRRRPATHSSDFADRHGAEASARPATCETCHTRAMCLDCHRPVTASLAESAPKAGHAGRNTNTDRTGSRTRRGDYHPAAFLTRHPSSAYGREADCSDCHNPAQFCQSCHRQSGLVAASRIGQRGYHDAFRGFSLGHGQAARQSLESCVSCHAERDCTACHSAVGGGFRFSPHGPSFDAARARSKNPLLCVACHGRAIPTVR